MKKQQKVPSRAQKPQNSFLFGGVAITAAILWISTLQFYIVQLLAGRAWQNSFSLSQNYISDLGDTLCLPNECSPLHVAMNVSFVVLGLSILVGALLFAYTFRQNNGAVVGFLCLALSGFGTVLVGLFPSDVNGDAHGTGAYLSFLVGNVALVVIGLRLREVNRWLRVAALYLGVVALIALPFFMNKTYLGLGVGTIERIIAYPQTMWMIPFGIYVIANRLKARKTTAL